MGKLIKREGSILRGVCSAFIPGLGQLFKGQITKAVSYFLFLVILSWIIRLNPIFIFDFVLGIIWLVGWIGNIFDAYSSDRE